MSKKAILILLTALCIYRCSSNSGGNSGTGGNNGSDRSQQGGATTVADRSSGAYTNPAPNMNVLDGELHDFGDGLFETTFVPVAPVFYGLGPLYNNTSCVACHVGNGRGAAALGTSTLGSQLLVRVSVPGGIPAFPGAPGAVPGLGTQLQDHAIVGDTPEADISITWTESPGTYGDGTAYSLRSPNLVITPTGAPLPMDVEISLRNSPPVFGLGLLQAIPDEVLESMEDPSDADGDGISGHVNIVWDEEIGATAIGRFGRKAGNPTLQMQAASAFFEDMGISNPMFPGTDIFPDIDEAVLEGTAFYTATLGVPHAVNIFDPVVQRGEFLFKELNCTGCHVQTLVTGESDISQSLSFQRIFPYTDLLLHDMGPGLADNRFEFEATGTEWRTPPLWGLGATEIVLGSQAVYLHDGRARTLEEAILWHGGEAGDAQEAFRTLPEEDRNAIIAFLRSL